MKRYIPWVDILVFGGLAMLALVAEVVVLLFGKEVTVTGHTVMGATAATFIFIAIVVLLKKYKSRPDYIDKHGVATWIDGIQVLRDDLRVYRAMQFFAQRLPALLAAEFPAYLHGSRVTTANIIHMYDGMQIEWRRKPLSVMSRWGWSVKDKAGLQQGKSIMLHWQGSVVESALYHELLHAVDELVLHQPPDYKHEKAWWKLLVPLKYQAKVEGIH